MCSGKDETPIEGLGKSEAGLAGEGKCGDGRSAIHAGEEMGELDAGEVDAVSAVGSTSCELCTGKMGEGFQLGGDGAHAHRNRSLLPCLRAASFVHQGARNHRIRHSCGGSGGYCHCCHYAFSSKDTGAVGCHSCGHQWSVRQPYGQLPARQGLEDVFRWRFLVGASLERRASEKFALRGLVPRDCRGQGTLEYALVMVGFLSVVAALASLWRVLDGGVLVEHALMSASHHVQAVAPGVATDVFLF